MTPEEAEAAVHEAAAALQRALDGLTDCDPPMTPEDLAGMLLSLQAYQKEIGQYVASVEATIVQLMPEKQMRLPDGTLCESVSSSTKTTWDNRRLLSLLCIKAEQARQVHPQTGEIEDVGTAIEAALQECCAVAYWRLGALEKYGIEGRDFRQTEWGRKKLKFTKPAPSPEAA